MKTSFKDFLKCGVIGWCLEILFTALCSFRKHDYRLMGVTSLWMFPIYGLAFVIKPLSHILCRKPMLIRGLIYMAGIFTAEYLSGEILTRRRLCPWNYHFCYWQIHDIIRLDFAPLWFLVGLLYEKILTHAEHHTP